MKHVFELYLTSDQLSKEQWMRFYTLLTAQLGVLAKSKIIMAVEDNVVRFFVASDRDLGQLSNNIDLGILRPVSPEVVALPSHAGREGFVKYIAGGNLLDLRENLALKKGKQLQFAVFNLRHVSATKTLVNLELYMQTGDQWSMAKKLITGFPAHLLAVDFAANTHYLRKTPPLYLNIEKTLQLFEPADVSALFSVSTFPYFPRDYYLPLTNYEFDKHSFIVGATGSGKSKLIQLFIERLSASQLKVNYRVIVIDPHDSLRNDLDGLPDTHVVNFANESAELFGSEVQTDISAATELTTSLLKSLLGDQFNARLERVLRFSLFVLFTGQTMSLDFLKRFLTELELRNQVLNHVEGHVPTNIQRFFGSDFNDIRTTYYNEAILPIVSLVDEMQMQPNLGGQENEQSLARLIQSNFLTVFSLNKVSMGEKVTKTVAGLLIQQIFLLAQARAFNERVILVIDEVSVIQNPAIAAILAEARKFNLSVILTQQYFGQVEKDLRDAIFANVYNYYAFRVSEEDASTLAGNLNMEIPKEIIESEAKKGLKEEQIKIKLLTELHPRECMVRISANGQVLPCFKARTVDALSHDRPTVHKQDLKSYSGPVRPAKFVESAAKESLPTLSATPPAESSPPEAPQPKENPGDKQSKAAPRLGSIVATSTIASDPYGQPTVSLSELLASQSSSREK